MSVLVPVLAAGIAVPANKVRGVELVFTEVSSYTAILPTDSMRPFEVAQSDTIEAELIFSYDSTETIGEGDEATQVDIVTQVVIGATRIERPPLRVALTASAAYLTLNEAKRKNLDLWIKHFVTFQRKQERAEVLNARRTAAMSMSGGESPVANPDIDLLSSELAELNVTEADQAAQLERIEKIKNRMSEAALRSATPLSLIELRRKHGDTIMQSLRPATDMLAREVNSMNGVSTTR